jgi:hypothetical protein
MLHNMSAAAPPDMPGGEAMQRHDVAIALHEFFEDCELQPCVACGAAGGAGAVATAAAAAVRGDIELPCTRVCPGQRRLLVFAHDYGKPCANFLTVDSVRQLAAAASAVGYDRAAPLFPPSVAVNTADALAPDAMYVSPRDRRRNCRCMRHFGGGGGRAVAPRCRERCRCHHRRHRRHRGRACDASALLCGPSTPALVTAAAACVTAAVAASLPRLLSAVRRAL